MVIVKLANEYFCKLVKLSSDSNNSKKSQHGFLDQLLFQSKSISLSIFLNKELEHRESHIIPKIFELNHIRFKIYLVSRMQKINLKRILDKCNL